MTLKGTIRTFPNFRSLMKLIGGSYITQHLSGGWEDNAFRKDCDDECETIKNQSIHARSVVDISVYSYSVTFAEKRAPGISTPRLSLLHLTGMF